MRQRFDRLRRLQCDMNRLDAGRYTRAHPSGLAAWIRNEEVNLNELRANSMIQRFDSETNRNVALIFSKGYPREEAALYQLSAVLHVHFFQVFNMGCGARWPQLLKCGLTEVLLDFRARTVK